VKRRVLTLVVSVTAILGMTVASPPTASAAKGTCVSEYSLVRASRWGAEGATIDKNANSWVCQKPLPGDGNFNVIDDHA
jgi:hypothetical protein